MYYNKMIKQVKACVSWCTKYDILYRFALLATQVTAINCCY